MQHLSFLEILQICRFRGFLPRLVALQWVLEAVALTDRSIFVDQGSSIRQELLGFRIKNGRDYEFFFSLHLPKCIYWHSRSTRRLELSVGPALPVRSSAMNFRIGDKVLITSTGFDKTDWFGKDRCHSILFAVPRFASPKVASLGAGSTSLCTNREVAVCALCIDSPWLAYFVVLAHKVLF